MFRAPPSGPRRCCRACGPATNREEYIGFQRAIVAAQTAAMSGFPTWDRMSAAYAAAPGVTAEAVSAVGPVQRRFAHVQVGGIGDNSTPWTLAATR